MKQRGNMELKIWGRTMLSVQRHLGRVARKIDEIIMKKAIASVYVTSKNLMEQSSENVSNFILNMSESKVNLINLNTICVNALKGIDKISAKILILKHIDGQSGSEISKLLNLSDRTYYRRLNSAYENIAVWLKKNNYTPEFFQKHFSKEGWIMETYYLSKNLFETNNKDVEKLFFENGFFGNVVNKITKAAQSSYS